jgi:Tripartite tricarboxylate transporter family receptor
LGAVVKADDPFKKWQDVIEFGKANPGKFTYATIGPATTIGRRVSNPTNAAVRRDPSEAPVSVVWWRCYTPHTSDRQQGRDA